MNGERYLLDTNAVIQLLKGNSGVSSLLENADSIALSIIAEMEYFSFSGLNDHDVGLYRVLKSRVRVFDVPADDEVFTRMVVMARQKYGLKLPDAIIAATARKNGLTLLTADDHFKKLKSPRRDRRPRVRPDSQNNLAFCATLTHWKLRNFLNTSHVR